VYNHSHRTAWYDWGLPTRDRNGNDIFERVDRQYSPHQIGDYATLEGYGAVLKLRRKLSERATWHLGATLAGNDIDTRGHYPVFADAVPDAQGNVGLQFRHFTDQKSGVFATNYFTLSARTGAFQHNLAFGVDVLAGNTRGREISAASTDELPGNVESMNIFEPVFTQRLTENYTFTGGYTTPQRVRLLGGYIEDQINIGRFSALLAVRYDRYVNQADVNGEEIENELLNPNLGLVYRLRDDLSIYGSYTQGFAPQLTQNPAAGGPFDPLYSKQVEAGIKGLWWGGRLTTTAGLYQIRRVNELVPANDPAQPERLRQTGETRSEGLEVDVSGALTPYLNIIAGYAYNDARIARSTVQGDVGSALPNAPRHLSSAWLRYDLSGPLHGLSLGAGFRTVGERFGAFNRSRFTGYTLLDGALYYRRRGLAVSVNGYNLTDESYITGVWSDFYAQRGLPRNLMVRVALDQ
jgi:iron complex outermembrane receptor protein